MDISNANYHGGIRVTEWERHMDSLLGEQVTVTYAEDLQEHGQLIDYDDEGEVTLLADDGEIHYIWPNLDTVPRV